MSTEPTRDELIKICERGFVPQRLWRNRDTAGAQIQLGHAYALLRAGCDFHVALAPSSPSSDDKTWWIWITYKGFGAFDHGGVDDEEMFYLPTAARLDSVNGGDWY